MGAPSSCLIMVVQSLFLTGAAGPRMSPFMVNMWEPQGCCFCCSLRTGSIFLCSLFVVISLLDVTCMIKVFFKGHVVEKEIETMCEDKFSYESDCQVHVQSIITGVVSFRVIVDFLKLTLSTLMILSILKKKIKLMIPLMIMVFTELVLSLLTGTVIIILLATIGTGKAAVEIAVVIGLVVFFETYLLLVFRAYYMQIKREDEQMERLLDEITDIDI
nr:uncharacterized protein LOC123765525 isoform X1 [Procambarus clarkii]